jgi:hypothetical protein
VVQAQLELTADPSRSSALSHTARAAIARWDRCVPVSLYLPPLVDPAQHFDVWLAELLREFDDVVNTSKTLPPLSATKDVFHHIKTSGPPISFKICHLDEELRAAKLEFEQLEKVCRSDSPWVSPLHMVQKADGSS